MGMESRGESLALELTVWGSHFSSPTHSLGDLDNPLHAGLPPKTGPLPTPTPQDTEDRNDLNVEFKKYDSM